MLCTLCPACAVSRSCRRLEGSSVLCAPYPACAFSRSDNFGPEILSIPGGCLQYDTQTPLIRHPWRERLRQRPCCRLLFSDGIQEFLGPCCMLREKAQAGHGVQSTELSDFWLAAGSRQGTAKHGVQSTELPGLRLAAGSQQGTGQARSTEHRTLPFRSTHKLHIGVV